MRRTSEISEKLATWMTTLRIQRGYLSRVPRGGLHYIEQSNPYLNNKRAFTVGRSLRGAVPGIVGRKSEGLGRIRRERPSCFQSISVSIRTRTLLVQRNALAPASRSPRKIWRRAKRRKKISCGGNTEDTSRNSTLMNNCGDLLSFVI